jgi:hypothetical protein
MSATDRAEYVKPYLDLYLRSVDADLRVQDVDFPSGRADTSNIAKVDSDSDDSYAATMLTLAWKYFELTGDGAWVTANLPMLTRIAYANLAMAVKPNGLTSVFAGARSSTNSIGYLMDNCEVYRGLRDFSKLLNATEVANAAYYDNFATGIAAGIRRELYKATDRAFTASDANPVVTDSFYPGATCQVYPQVFGLTELADTYDGAWDYLSAKAVGWESGGLDAFPWAILGYAAALRGQKALAQAQMGNTERVFKNNQSLVTINELGFYLRTRAIVTA